MARMRYTPEQVIGMLREAEVRLAQGERVGVICRSLRISEQSYYRWRREYGGLKVSQARRLKELEKEIQRLRKAVSNLTLDALILKEVVEGSRQTSVAQRTEPFAAPCWREPCVCDARRVRASCLQGDGPAPFNLEEAAETAR